MRLTTADDDQARARAQAATRERQPAKSRGDGYLSSDAGELAPRYCRCSPGVADRPRLRGRSTARSVQGAVDLGGGVRVGLVKIGRGVLEDLACIASLSKVDDQGVNAWRVMRREPYGPRRDR